MSLKQKRSNMTTKIKAILGLGLVAGIGVGLMPLTSYAATDSTVVNVIIDEQITLSASDTINVLLDSNQVSNEILGVGVGSAVVNTNNAAGYTLTLSMAAAAADQNLNGTGTAVGSSFTPVSGTFAAPAALTPGTWGFNVAASNAPTDVAAVTTFGAVPAFASPVTISSSTGPIANSSTTVVVGAMPTSTLPAGTYTNTITFTATTN